MILLLFYQEWDWSILFIFNDPVDFLTNSSDNAESTDFIPEERQTKDITTLSYEQGDNSLW